MNHIVLIQGNTAQSRQTLFVRYCLIVILFHSCLFLLTFLEITKVRITSTSGKIQPASTPLRISSPALCEMFPTIPGPIAPPRSPAMARRANIAVPPEGIFPEQMLMVPGHIIPTEKPHIIQPASPSMGISDREATR